MKKKNLKGLSLSKKTISNLGNNAVSGGDAIPYTLFCPTPPETIFKCTFQCPTPPITIQVSFCVCPTPPVTINGCTIDI